MNSELWEAVRPIIELALKDWGHTARMIALAVTATVIMILVHRYW